MKDDDIKSHVKAAYGPLINQNAALIRRIKRMREENTKLRAMLCDFGVALPPSGDSDPNDKYDVTRREE